LNPARLAELVSAATRLPLLSVPLFVAVGLDVAGWRGLLWALLCISLTSGLSLLYLVYLTHAGEVLDPRNIPRAERVRPLRVVAGLHAAAFVAVSLSGGPAELRAALLSYALATLLFVLLTPLSNLSLHAFLFLPLVFWARLVLGRHTLVELALGSLVGGGATWIAFQLTG
jgi:hypothetical protein